MKKLLPLMLIFSLTLFFACDTGGGSTSNPDNGGNTDPDNGNSGILTSGIKLTNGNDELIGYVTNFTPWEVELITPAGYYLSIWLETSQVSAKAIDYAYIYFDEENGQGNAFSNGGGRYGKIIIGVDNVLYTPTSVVNNMSVELTTSVSTLSYKSTYPWNIDITNESRTFTENMMALKVVTNAEVGLPASLDNLQMIFPE